MGKTDKRSWLAGFLAGGAIGAITAVLTAPRSGEKTRELIRERGEEIRDNAMQTIDDGRARLGEMATDARHRMQNLRSVGEEVVEDQKEVLEKGARKAKRAVKDKEPAAA